MSAASHQVLRSSFLLGLIALLGTALLAGVNDMTHERIVEQEKRRVLQQLKEIVPASSFNNDLLKDRIEVADKTIYRARMDDKAVAVLMMVTASGGYNGDISLLIGIDVNSRVLGVRVVSHRETPGLGDPIELEKSDWILGFNHKSLRQPEPPGWAVKKDGGQFDQFTGATISPRAVVRAVHNTLIYFAENRQLLFELPEKSGT